MDGTALADLVELDEQDLAGAVLVERDRLRRAGVGVGHAAGLRLLGGVPVTEGQVVEAGRGDLIGRDDDLVAVRLARDRDGAVDHPDVPRRRGAGGLGVEVAERAVRGSLGREDRAVDDRVAGGQVDARGLGREDRHEVVVRRAAGQGLEVVRPVDRRAVVAVVGAGDDDGPDLGPGQALELGRHALDRPTRLDVAVEQVAGDQEQVDLLGEGEVDGGHECRELPFALRARLITEVVVARAEMDVRGVDDP